MEKYPLMKNGKVVGELTVLRQSEETVFSAVCTLSEDTLWCIRAVGEQGTVRIGVLETKGGKGQLRQRLSDRLVQPAGKIQYGEIRPATEREASGWKPALRPELLFHTPWLRRGLRGFSDVLYRKDGSNTRIAIAYDGKAPYPLTQLFCLSCIYRIEEKFYVVLTFDEKERPVF